MQTLKINETIKSDNNKDVDKIVDSNETFKLVNTDDNKVLKSTVSKIMLLRRFRK